MESKEYEEIKREIESGKTESAMEHIDCLLENGHASDARLHYLKGSAYMKKGDWRGAINCFLESEELDPESPAKEAREMLYDILEFYNKDMYNQ